MGSGFRSKFSFPNGFSILCFVAVMIGVVSTTEIKLEEEGCAGGTCPSPTPYGGSNSDSSEVPAGKGGCGLWMGPSPIKKAAEHDFGLGIFTGKVRIYIALELMCSTIFRFFPTHLFFELEQL